MVVSECVGITWLDRRAGMFQIARLGKQHVLIYVAGDWNPIDLFRPGGTLRCDSGKPPAGLESVLGRHWSPDWSWEHNIFELIIPLWTLAIIPATLGVCLSFRPRPPSLHCLTCNYSLAGIPSNICPECGTPHAAKQS